MRTTLTIEDPLAERLQALAKKRAEPLEAVANEALLLGLEVMTAPPAKPYRTRPRSLGLRPGIDPDKLGQVADDLEDLARQQR